MIQLKTRPTDKVIELGGGSCPLVHPNVDVRPCYDANGNPTVDFTADFHEPLPIQSDEWDGVFSQFVIEHIAYPKVSQFVGEIFRILKPGGKAAIITANTEAQLKWVLDNPNGWDGKDPFESASCKLFGDQRHGERQGDKNYVYDSHKTYFSPPILVKLFQDAGFVDIALTPYGERQTDIVVEAVKPLLKPEAETVKYAGALASGMVYRGDQTWAGLPVAEPRTEKEEEEERRVMEGDPNVPKPQGAIHAKMLPAMAPGALSFPPNIEETQFRSEERLQGIYRTEISAEQTQGEKVVIDPATARSEAEGVDKRKAAVLVPARTSPNCPKCDQPVDMSKPAEVVPQPAGYTHIDCMDKRKAVVLAPEGARQIERVLNDSTIPRHEGKEMPDADPSVLLPARPSPAELFDRHYFNGGGKVGGYSPWYWDYPCHEITARHVLSRRPGSVLELGCARGYVLKRVQDVGIEAKGIEVSKHCYMTRVCEGIALKDICGGPWWAPLSDQPIPGLIPFDLCFSIAVLDHIPEQYLPAVIREMARTSKRCLHGINFGPVGDDKTRVTCRPKEWWTKLFVEHFVPHTKDHGWPSFEIVDKNELESGTFPEDVFRGDGKIKLNIGCAQTMFHHGWVNIDVFDYGPWPQQNGYQYQRHDIRNSIPWGTCHVDCIYCGHMLEHLSYREGIAFLRDCRRVLKPDGAMRIIVPDADKLQSLYVCAKGHCDGSWDHLLESENLSHFDEVNEGCANAPTSAGKLYSLLHEGHQAIYDSETLLAVLEDAGFATRQSSFRNTDLHGGEKNGSAIRQILCETLDTHPALSLFVDAVPRVG